MPKKNYCSRLNTSYIVTTNNSHISHWFSCHSGCEKDANKKWDCRKPQHKTKHPIWQTRNDSFCSICSIYIFSAVSFQGCVCHSNPSSNRNVMVPSKGCHFYPYIFILFSFLAFLPISTPLSRCAPFLPHPVYISILPQQSIHSWSSSFMVHYLQTRTNTFWIYLPSEHRKP